MSHLVLGEWHQLYYESLTGDAGRPWLVFLHEGLGSVAQWGGFPQELCSRTRCPGLVYDRLGHGQSSALVSPRTGRYLHEYALDELPKVLAALLPGQRFVLIGHSDGGSISLIFGAENPGGLLGIVTAAAHVMVEEVTVEGVRNALAAWEQGKLRKGLGRYHGEKSQTLFRAWAETWTSPEFRSWSIEALLPSIAVPLLVLQGRDDQYGTPAQVEAIVTRSGGSATPLLLEECGHSPHLDFPELTLDLMACFVNRLAR
ncbi:MAG: alpha/beta hydrolase [Desulfobulbus sp.]|jgi:pimeloyl-ACP methyl ester carboxylesterase|uniref:alpha/beta fold hydrolase n=1 Tax=Desulfobulbus sp. TaxID=895 RepID=UPI0028434AF3|nr:alpha/beta hydrolase [Desulfobulbus sp.]MDR2550222.1 alpha/beta hydrolase [Desulfobulbus sp.]